MVDKAHEYDSLRQELLDYQKGRSTTLSLTLTVVAALLGAGAQFSNPLLPLSALLVIFLARIQVAQSHASVQRIASYIRIMFEKDSENLNWETGSYCIRRASIASSRDGTQAISHNSPLLPVDWFLFACSVVAIVLAGFIAVFTPTPSPPAQPTLLWPPVIYFGVIGFTTLVWGAAWWRYGQTIRNLEKMVVDDREAEFWEKFKKEVKAIKEEGQAKP